MLCEGLDENAEASDGLVHDAAEGLLEVSHDRRVLRESSELVEAQRAALRWRRGSGGNGRPSEKAASGEAVEVGGHEPAQICED